MTAFTIPTVETERLILRAPHADDLPGMIAFYASERSHMVGGPRDADDCWQVLARRLGHWALKGFGTWHLTEKASDAFVGGVGIIEVPGWDEPELGWGLQEQAEGKGLAFEAALAARSYAATHQGISAPISYITQKNTRSRALAERLGATFEREGSVLGEACQVWRHPAPMRPEASNAEVCA